MKKQNKYKSNDFLRYFKGEMTNPERHSFEKDSQRDPFTEEALQGLEEISPENAENDLADLTSKLNRRVRRKRRMTIYRIAASIAVLMVISSVFVVVEKNNSIRQEAIPEYKSVTMDIAKSEPVYKPEKEELTSTDVAAHGQIPATSEKSKVTQPELNVAENKEAKIQEPQPAEEEDVSSAKKEVRMAVRDLPEGERMATDEGVAGSRKEAVASSRTRTDTAIPAAYGAVGSKADADYVPPRPLNGSEAFDKYISGNIIRPDSATSGQRVVVVTSVKILSDGTIDSIKIIRSPGKAFSDEAMRLIRSGPLWQPAMRNGIAVEDEVRLRIVFP